MKRDEVLDTAKSYVTQDRAAEHGRAEDNLGRIAALWSADLGIPIGPTDVARLMVLLKMARSRTNPDNDDNWIDAAGYAALAGEMAGRGRGPANGVWVNSRGEPVDRLDAKPVGGISREPNPLWPGLDAETEAFLDEQFQTWNPMNDV